MKVAFASLIVLAMCCRSIADEPLSTNLLKPTITLAPQGTVVQGPKIKLRAETGDGNTLSLVLPTTPLQVGQQFQLTVQGVPPASLPDMQILCAPAEGLTWVAGTGLKGGSPAFIACTATQAGKYTFLIAARDATTGMLSTSQVLTVGSVIPPVPPGPEPPPGPGPSPGPGPNPVQNKVRVLLIYPDSGTMSKDQYAMIYDMAPGSLRDYLTNHCITESVKTAEGAMVTLSGFRVWPTSIVPTSGQLQPLYDAAKEFKDDQGKTKPAMVVETNGKVRRYDFPVSKTDALDILKPIAGE